MRTGVDPENSKRRGRVPHSPPQRKLHFNQEKEGGHALLGPFPTSAYGVDGIFSTLSRNMGVKRVTSDKVELS